MLPAPHLPPVVTPPWVTRRDLRVAAGLVGALAVAGIALGFLWSWWSPRTHAFVWTGHGLVPEENESMIAADARYVMLTGGVGLLAGLAMWFWRGSRGPVAITALALGGLAGAALTWLVGRLVGGGTTDGADFATITMPLSLHATPLVVVEALLAVAVYSLCATVSEADDLGRPGPQPAWPVHFAPLGAGEPDGPSPVNLAGAPPPRPDFDKH